MDKNLSEAEVRMATMISAICGLFSHEQANSMLTRSFLECQSIPHKTDCIRTILEQVIRQPDLFFSKLNAIIRLHSNVLREKPQLFNTLNQELRLLNLKYNLSELHLEVLSGFEPYLMVNPFLELETALIKDEFYKNLISEINLCFGTCAYSSTMVMLRKLFENLTKDLLRKQFQNNPATIQYYWKDGQFINFHQLIGNLEAHLPVFQHYSEKLNADLIVFLRRIKYTGNEATHTIEDSITLIRLENLKKEITYYLKLFLRVLG